jgi:hypothetical protein
MRIWNKSAPPARTIIAHLFLFYKEVGDTLRFEWTLTLALVLEWRGKFAFRHSSGEESGSAYWFLKCRT